MLILRDHQKSATINMATYSKGQVIMPTGSGKTITMIDDVQARLVSAHDRIIVVVAPTIALTNQLSREFGEHINNAHVLHVHSGDSGHFTTTEPALIAHFCSIRGHKLVFTSYHSLCRIIQSNVKVDTVYFDEAHNSVKRQWFDDVKKISETADRCYYFTASPKHSLTDDKPGMNDEEVYGDTICEVPVTQMIDEEYIVPPSLHVITSDSLVDGKYPADVDVTNLLKSIDDHDLKSVLVSCKNTTQLFHLTNSERFKNYVDDNEYDYYSISSRYGCFINDQKVRRDVMFTHLRNNSGKFILFHIETCCEGINLPKLDGIILLKKLSTIRLIQSIGRVLRLDEGKTEGKVIVPVYSRYMKRAEKPILNMMQRVYEQGQTPVEFIRR